MKHDLDLFRPVENRWDRDPNAKLLNIVFQGGTFGNFLKFMLDKFSKLSPDIDGDPFTEIGTSHSINHIKFSGLIQKYHDYSINDNKGMKDLPVCIIHPTRPKHYLYLKQAQLFRVGHERIRPDYLWQKAVGEMPDRIKKFAADMIKMYGMKGMAHFSWIPKFIVRDWYKLEFLQPLEDTYDYQWFQGLKSHNFFDKQNTRLLDLESFFNWDTFITNIKEIDKAYGLELDYDKQDEMKKLFDKGYELDIIRKECNMIEEVLEFGTDLSLTDLDVSTEAYLYAYYEKRHPDIQMPLTNRFFRDIDEINQYLEHFPEWYKKSNPNIG